jgi:four helix bundle protein
MFEWRTDVVQPVEAWSSYEDWVASVSAEITGDSLWKIDVYRLAVFIGDISWRDVTRLIQDKRTLGLSDQLYRALGSISANIAEGYSRGTGKDRARFYEYALGSARESRDWYFKSRFVLGLDLATHRIRLITRIIQLLLVMVPDQRGRALREAEPEYHIYPASPHIDSMSVETSDALLRDIPMTPDAQYSPDV